MNRSSASTYSAISKHSIPPPGSVLTGKQEHYLKRELISQQTEWEISELASETALQRFGAPFKSDAGEVAPEDSELPLLRYMFVHHVRNFPFLDRAREKEFWQDKLQTFLESFATKRISSSEDRLEETKRRKLAIKAQKLVELMMVSGLPTASGYEERIRFSEMEVVDRQANEEGLALNVPEGHQINGWDVNVASVRTTSVKRHVRHHAHAEFLLRVKRQGKPEIYVGRRYSEFAQMHKRLRLELPGKVLPPLPRKNHSNSLYSRDDDDDDSISSVSTQDVKESTLTLDEPAPASSGFRSYLPNPFGGGHRRTASRSSQTASPRASMDASSTTRFGRKSGDYGRDHSPPKVLYREEQRVSLRAFLRNFLQNESIAQSKAMSEFLTGNVIRINEEEMEDVKRRVEMDEKRIEEQRRFYEIARQRARELDVHMEKFRRDVVESNGLTKLFAEIKQKNTIAELSPEYKKFAEWLRIEVAAVIYHLFLAEDNSPELFAQAKRIHSLIPYTALKQVIRFANPAAVMAGVLDLFLAQPFGAKSLLQRIFSLALGDSIKTVQKSIDGLAVKINEPVFCEKIKNYNLCDQDLKDAIRREAAEDDIDLLVAVLRSEDIKPELKPDEIGRAFNAYVAWNSAVENIDEELRSGAETFAHLKQLLKLYTRQRDKTMMLRMIEEPTTLQLFRDLFTIFYEPLVRVYKSANVYNSISDFARFMDDMISVVEKCQRQDVSADPNQTVQAFIDLCARHEDSFYKFVHEVHLHDNGLFDQLMGWIEGILSFLRTGPRGGGKLDMNALFQGAVEMRQIDQDAAVREINSLIKWQEKRKKWHQDKTRQKMATGDAPNGMPDTGASDLIKTFKPDDFGLNALDIQDLNDDEDEYSSTDEDEEDADPIAAERKRRARRQDFLRRSAGEPVKPDIVEVTKMRDGFLAMLRMVLAE
ncbi:hypothetical protein AUEXF2481DRAFT_63782 [Aureobasidium subglaciale EXF-2481]|uniref:PX domain-containing protein n=1 Tax=Aureobasidium subglaciale (strain EXF-2481) TaxID=1043005 RepID=A0A074YMQ0_AURSE|nr:uncharacterized protein AUEXF2481DRAFT_63782 [Aureobasidium subglaciale EXF-2481]KEQ97379.1 hypothetical protein AUEXF2481DRAFT_63782 [Aureobasidium subglaciale EXF-2481]